MRSLFDAAACDGDGDCGAGCGHLHAPRGGALERDSYVVGVVGSVWRVMGCWQAGDRIYRWAVVGRLERGRRGGGAMFQRLFVVPCLTGDRCGGGGDREYNEKRAVAVRCCDRGRHELVVADSDLHSALVGRCL